MADSWLYEEYDNTSTEYDWVKKYILGYKIHNPKPIVFILEERKEKQVIELDDKDFFI
jgi:hypothetical protein